MQRPCNRGSRRLASWSRAPLTLALLGRSRREGAAPPCRLREHVGAGARRGLPRRSGKPLSSARAEQRRHQDCGRHDQGRSGWRRGPSAGRADRPGGLLLGLASVRAPGRRTSGRLRCDPRRRAARRRPAADTGASDDLARHVVEVENEHVRVTRVQLGPGESLPAHTHRRGWLAVIVAGRKPGEFAWHRREAACPSAKLPSGSTSWRLSRNRTAFAHAWMAPPD